MSGKCQHDLDDRCPDRAGAAYEDDYYRWTVEQAALLRAGHLDPFDRLNLAEEIEGLGGSEYSALESALAVIILHRLKRDVQPEGRSRSWAVLIREHCRRVARNLKANPSLKARSAEATVEHDA